MGNTLAACGHLLNDLYPHIFSYLSPRDLVSVALTSKRFQLQVSDEVWKELCRRDFGALLEAHRQARRSSATTSSSSGAEPTDEEDGGKEEHKTQHKKKKDQRGEALEDEEEDMEAGSSSLFRKVLVTGLALRLGRGLAQRGQKNQAGDDHGQQPQSQPHHHHVDEDKSYKELYRAWASRVLIVYHVYSNDQAEQDVERVLRLEGIEGKYTTRTAESAMLKEQLASALPHYKTVLYMSNGGVSSQFQAIIGDALADFVERGGAVLIFPFATATERLLGRWDELGCNPMLSEAQTSLSSSLCRPPLCPDHPLFKDVGKVTASYRGTGLPAPSAKALAYYEDNNLFAAELNVGAGLVLAINLFPPSCPEGTTQSSRDGGWRAEEGNDVPRVLRNAVRYAMATQRRRGA